jgi:hypothetical protein
MPTLIEYKSTIPVAGGENGCEQSPKENLKFVKKSQSLDFTGFSPSEIGLITEIEIG